ncbi:MAG: DUF1294 domain-containing protein [Peptostreptococcaceae bacterium]|nr:DUF1294 domain-containing protein [Peptostreptococcaceae bacterium]
MLYLGFALWNFVVFLIYGIDKKRARDKKWRVNEKYLIGLAFLLGGAGALLGMIFFHHKTQKISFRILIPFALLCNAAWIYFRLS